MTRRVFALCAGAVAVVPLAFVVSACSSDDTPGASSGVTQFGSDSGTSNTEGGNGGDGSAPGSKLCNGLTLGGDVIAELAVQGEMPPALGGAIVPGIYDLTELQVYGSYPDAGPAEAGTEPPPVNPATGKAARVTVIVLPSSLRFIEARGTADALGPESTRAYTYRADESSIAATQACPAAAPARMLPYSAVGAGLAILPDPTHREVYVRR